ncbi:hypothetical protein ACWEQC_07580, partial [Streptomyces shenzhenensis]
MSAPVAPTPSSPGPGATSAGEARTSGQPGSPHPAATLSVTAAVPIPAPSRPYVDFPEGTDLDEEALRQIDRQARHIVADGLRDLSAGLRIPAITVTGYGNGPRFTIGSSAVRQAERTGLRR